MEATERPTRTTAVIVSYNRRELLLEAVEAVLAQDVPVSRLVVVDNASDDGSADAVQHAFPSVDIVRMPVNLGGAGGFAVGMAVAVQSDSDWVWVMDDDTIPTPTAHSALLTAVSADGLIDVAGSKVVWTDGREHPMNTPRRKPFVRGPEARAARAAGVTAVRSSSFVSMMIRSDAIRRRGLPVADYFIWNDDFEYSTRLLRGRRGVFVPASVVVHKTRVLGATDADPGERFYYEVRNKMWMFLRSHGLAPWEKAVYGASSVRRWIRTFVRSSDRATLRSGLRRGLRDGFRAPRDNRVVLGGLGEVTTAVEQAESRVRLGASR